MELLQHSLEDPMLYLHLSHAVVQQETSHTPRHVHFGNITDESSKQ